MIVYVDKPKTKYYNSAMKRLILPILIIVVRLRRFLRHVRLPPPLHK